MAGDWIKIEHATPDKEEISHLAELLNLDEDRVMGILLRVWIWADQTSTDGELGPAGMRAINRKANVKNFAENLLKTGWLKVKKDGFCFPKFDRHNGNSAKKRALGLQRKRAQRSRECHARSVTKTGPEYREESIEKKKKKPPTPLPEFGGPQKPAAAVSPDKSAALMHVQKAHIAWRKARNDATGLYRLPSTWIPKIYETFDKRGMEFIQLVDAAVMAAAFGKSDGGKYWGWGQVELYLDSDAYRLANRKPQNTMPPAEDVAKQIEAERETQRQEDRRAWEKLDETEQQHWLAEAKEQKFFKPGKDNAELMAIELWARQAREAVRRHGENQ